MVRSWQQVGSRIGATSSSIYHPKSIPTCPSWPCSYVFLFRLLELGVRVNTGGRFTIESVAIEAPDGSTERISANRPDARLSSFCHRAHVDETGCSVPAKRHRLAHPVSGAGEGRDSAMESVQRGRPSAVGT